MGPHILIYEVDGIKWRYLYTGAENGHGIVPFTDLRLHHEHNYPTHAVNTVKNLTGQRRVS